MGAIISNDSDRNDLLKRSSVKLQAQQIAAFSGNAIKWHAWKKKTRAAIGTAGMLRVIDNEIYAARNNTDNETIFHLLQVSTADGTAAHLVDMYEDERDGRKAYLELVKWYEGDELTTETAEDVREKLEKATLSTKSHASQYINEFLQHTKHLEELDESYTVSKTVSIFLNQITDPDYRDTVEACHINKYGISKCIEQVRAKERRLERERGARRRTPMVLRRTETKREVSEDEKFEDDAIVLKNYINESGYYSVPREKWQLLSDSDRSYVKSYNGKLRKSFQKSNKSNDNIKYNQRQVNTRRTVANEKTADEDINPSPTKRRRTVQFQDNNDGEEKIEQLNGEPTGEKTVNHKRNVLSFRVKDDKE